MMMTGTMIMTMTMVMIVMMMIMLVVVVMIILVFPVEKDQGRVPRHKTITIGLHLKLVGSMFFYQPQYSESSLMRVFRLSLITSAIVCAALILPKREAGNRLRWPILEIFSLEFTRNDISKLFSNQTLVINSFPPILRRISPEFFSSPWTKCAMHINMDERLCGTFAPLKLINLFPI